MTSSTAVPMPRDLRSFKHFDVLLNIFIVVLLISNLVGQKICAIGPFLISGAQLLFPLTYIFGDIFTEVYGYAASRRAIWLGLFASGLMAVMGMITVALPAAPGWPNQEAFAIVFGQIPRMVVASLAAFWCGEFANSYVLARMKILTEGKYLWMRTIGSTIVGQLVDTTVLMIIAFSGTVGAGSIVTLIFSGYLGKVLYEAAMTPVTYAVVNWLKRREHVDTFDYNTEFSPFHISR